MDAHADRPDADDDALAAAAADDDAATWTLGRRSSGALVVARRSKSRWEEAAAVRIELAALLLLVVGGVFRYRRLRRMPIVALNGELDGRLGVMLRFLRRRAVVKTLRSDVEKGKW